MFNLFGQLQLTLDKGIFVDHKDTNSAIKERRPFMMLSSLASKLQAIEVMPYPIVSCFVKYNIFICIATKAREKKNKAYSLLVRHLEKHY